MDSSTLPEAHESAAPHSSPPHSSVPQSQGLGAEVRESVVLLALAVGVTVGLTTAAQAAASLLG